LKKHYFPLLATFIASILGVLFLQSGYAATGLIKLSPASGTTEKNKNFTVEIRINPGDPVDGVETKIQYDDSKLQFVSIDAGGSAFPIELAQSGGRGSVTVTRGILGGTVSANNSLVAKVMFKALVGGSTVNLNLSGQSTSAGSYQDPGTTGASRTLTNPPAPAPDPSPDPAPEPEPTPTQPPAPKPDEPRDEPKDTEGDPNGRPDSSDKPPITKPNKPEQIGSRKIKLLPPKFRQAIFELSGAKAFKTYIEYGNGEELNLSTALSKLSKQHKIALDKNLLVPGTTYNYRVIIQEKDGKTTKSKISSFKTRGYIARVRVLGANKQPLANKLVTLRSDPVTKRTNSSGVAKFTDISPGKHSVIYKDGNKELKQTIQVEDVVKSASATTSPPQNFSVIFTVDNSGISTGLVAALVGALIAVGLALIFGVRKFANNTSDNNFPPSQGPPSGDSVVAFDNNPTQTEQSSGKDVNELLNHVQGGQTSDPGTVVTPNPNKEEKE